LLEVSGGWKIWKKKETRIWKFALEIFKHRRRDIHSILLKIIC